MQSVEPQNAETQCNIPKGTTLRNEDETNLQELRQDGFRNFVHREPD